MTKITVNNEDNLTDEPKPTTYRIKPSVAELIKKISFEEGITSGDLIGKAVEQYEKKNNPPEGFVLMGCISRFENTYRKLVKVPYTGEVVFKTNKIFYQPAKKYETELRQIYKLDSIDLADYEIGSALTLVRFFDNSGYILHECRCLRNINDLDFALIDQICEGLDPGGFPYHYLSSYVSLNDIISVLSFFADEMHPGTLFDIDFGDDDDDGFYN